MKNTGKKKKSLLEKFLQMVEKGGNALPHPATLFAIFALMVLILSAVTSVFDISVLHPGTGEQVRPVNLLTKEGVHLILKDLVINFTSFAPLGVVLVSLLGIGIAESSGFIGAALKLLVLSAPPRLLTFVIVFAGILSNAASEVGYVLLVPLSAIIFQAAGRHPIAGFAAAFAGVSGGYSANLLLGSIDPLLAGLSQEAARIIEPGYMVSPACNYYFMAVSTFFIAIAGTWVTEKLVEPRLGVYKGANTGDNVNTITKAEKRGLWYALGAFIAITALILVAIIPQNGYLRDPETGSLLHSPFMDGIVSFIFIIGALLGIVYGIGAKTIKNDTDVMNGMSKAMESLGMYLVLIFFASQFVAFFKHTNLGLIIAIKGASFLQASGMGPIPLMLSFVVISAIINLFMGSSSAKWTVMAPVFVPMFMLLGYTPELTQVVYRIGDSVTNIISPMMSYFALIIAYVQKYIPKAGIGTVVATMVPYSIVFMIVWTILLVIWISLGLPVGPGASILLP